MHACCSGQRSVVAVVLLALLGLTACVSESAPLSEQSNGLSGLVVGTNLRGISKGVSGATLEISSLDGALVSDADGYFVWNGGPVGEGGAVLRASAPGYGTIVKQVFLRADAPNYIHVQLKEAPNAQVFTVPQGDDPAVVLNESGFELRIEPGDLVFEDDGSPVSGDVEALLIPYDPANVTGPRPGPLVGIETVGSEPVPLISFAMSTIELSQDGRAVNVAAGQTLEHVMPVHPDRQAVAEAAQPILWWLNEETAIWEAEGSGVYDAEAGVFRALLPHLSSWNCDYPGRGQSYCTIIKTYDRAGKPINLSIDTPDGVQYSSACFNHACFPDESNRPADLYGGRTDNQIKIRYTLEGESFEQNVPVPGDVTCGANQCSDGPDSCQTICAIVPCLQEGEACPITVADPNDTTCGDGAFSGCCAGLSCIDGFCAPCREEGSECLFDADCCSGTCVGANLEQGVAGVCDK